MRLTWRDALASVFVLAATLLYLLWLGGVDVFGISSPRVMGIVVMVLGLAASVTAVVYGVGAGLLEASKAYLGVTSLIGLGALVAGVWAVVDANEPMLGALVIATGVLWLLSTVRHAVVAGHEGRHVPSGQPIGHAA